MDYSKLNELHNSLLEIMEKIGEDDTSVNIEYGDPKQIPGSYLSFIRIRRCKTPGGIQWRICELYHGTEGSGFYSFDLKEAAKTAMNMVQHYHRPTPFKEKLAKLKGTDYKQTNLDWFMFGEDDQKAPSLSELTTKYHHFSNYQTDIKLKY